MGDEKRIDEMKLVSSDKSRRSTLTNVSLLIVTLLLVVSVGSLIYLAVSSQHANCDQMKKTVKEPNESIEIKAKINIRENDESNTETEEDVRYDQINKVAYYHSPDGTFAADDFGKGIRVMKHAGDDKCYIIPIGGDAEDGNGFEQFMERNDGAVTEANRTESDYVVLGGEVEDISFVPVQARKRCHDGYQWMVPASGNADEAKARQKRAVLCTYRYVCYNSATGLFQYCYYTVYFAYRYSCPSTYP